MANHPRLYNFVRRDHAAVRSLIAQVDKESRSPEIDGIIVILASKHGAKTKTYAAGSLAVTEKASHQAYRLQLSLALEEEDNQK